MKLSEVQKLLEGAEDCIQLGTYALTSPYKLKELVEDYMIAVELLKLKDFRHPQATDADIREFLERIGE